MRTTEQIEELQRYAWALVSVVSALAQAGKTDEALAVAETIEESQERARALVKIADALVRVGEVDRARQVAENAVRTTEQIVEHRRAPVLVEVAGVLAQAGKTDEALKTISVMNDPSSRSRAQSAVIKALVRNGSTNDAADAMRVELAWVREIAQRHDAADYCATLAVACVDSANRLADSADAEPAECDRWLGLARSALARSWLYGASIWDRFGILMRVAPNLAMRLVNERILADPGDGAAPESDRYFGPEGPGGDTGSYR